MDMRTKVNMYPSRDELSVALALHVAKLAAAARAGQGRFCIALSGGSLIDIVFPALCSAPLRGSIDWSSWHVFWADERWVPWSSPESNYGLARDRFFSRVPIPRDQIHGTDNSIDPAATARTYESVLAKVFQPPEGQMPRFDLILLGIGEDGHTASLFPGHPVLAENKAWVAPVPDAPKPPQIRITMTLPLINNGRNVIFVAAGPGKADIVSKVLNPHMGIQKLPAQLVNPSDGELQWFIDRAAAAESGYTDVTALA
jgi:6-phosphogluconolactonase